MKKIVICLLLIASAAACGGGGGGRDEVSMRASYPAKLAAYAGRLRAEAVIVGDESAIISLPSGGRIDGDVWRFEIERIADMPSAGATFRADFWYSLSDGAPGKSESQTHELQLATVRAQVATLGAGMPLDPGEAAYDFSIDDDKDGLSNIDELIAGTDPKVGDTDGDGAPDGNDAFPSVVAEWGDLDGDGIGDNSDDDIDGDGILNAQELIIGSDVSDLDTDGDGIMDGGDNCALKANSDQLDADGDKRGDACDDDSDSDGLSDAEEARYGTDPFSADSDGDGLGDGYEIRAGSDPRRTDTDGDGVADRTDNCPLTTNADQMDIDRDARGDACDADRDGDGIENAYDNCPDAANANQEDIDVDGTGDECDVDADGDGIPNASDNCPYATNPNQLKADADVDGVPSECDLDDADEEVGSAHGAIFVDVAHGSDSGKGTRASPFASVARAAQSDNGKGTAIYVAAGIYDVANLALGSNAKIFGGFQNGPDAVKRFTSRDVRSQAPEYRSALTRRDALVTVVLSHDNIIVDGFYITNESNLINDITPSAGVEIISGNASLLKNTVIGNQLSPRSAGIRVRGGFARIARNWVNGGGRDLFGSESIGIDITKGAAELTNNIVVAGSGRFATGISIENADPVIVNNTIDARSPNAFLGASEGISIDRSSPVFVNNLVITGTAPDQYAISCYGGEPGASAAFSFNIFARFPAEANASIVRGCDGMGYTNAAFLLGAAEVKSNAIFGGADISGLVDMDYNPAGQGGPADCVDDGADTSSEIYGKVTADYSNAPRPKNGSYDVGARER